MALVPKPAKPPGPPKRITVGAVGAKKVESGAKGKGKQVEKRETIIIVDSSDEESEDEDANALQQAIRASLADKNGSAREEDGSLPEEDGSSDEEDEEGENEREKARIWGLIKFEKEEEDYLRTANWEEELRRCGVDDGEGDAAELHFDRVDSSSKGKEKSNGAS